MAAFDVQADTTAGAVIDDLVRTLQDARIAGQRVFQTVLIVQDEDSFFRFQDPLSGSIVGVVDSRAQEQPAVSSGDDKINCLSLSVVVGLYENTPMNGDVGPLVTKLADLVDIARQAVIVDRTRGGLCDVLMWNGKILRGTETWGQPRQLKRTPKNQPLFFATAVPITCGWRTPSS
jgi:hypothetical protein